MKRLCIICKKNKEENEFSEEHIFPEAIGNRHLVIYNVCRECNTKTLSKIDVLLTNDKLVETRRLMYKISGKRGDIPNPFQNGVLKTDPDQKIKLNFTKSDKAKISFIPKVKEDYDEKGKKYINVTVGENEENKLVGIINKKLKRMGKKEKSKNEILKSKKTISEIPTSLHTLKIDQTNYKKAILKIAYELGFYFLGDKYILDSAGEQIRLFLNNTTTNPRKYNINGHIDLFSPKIDTIDKCLFDFLQKLKIDNRYHIAYIDFDNNTNTISIVIKIFDVFSASIVISNNQISYTLPDKDLIIINPINGDFEVTSIEERITKIYG